MSEVEFERLFVLDEAGNELQLFRATLDGRETFGRSRARCLEQLAWELRRPDRRTPARSAETDTAPVRRGSRDTATRAARSNGSGNSG